MQTVIVVTNPELGWDCVVGVYASAEDAENECPEDDGYIHHSAMVD
tara:strand:- start:341 stop:478 length:138 start_codon:yes stop_codon:yes gene_type:complete